MVKPVLKSPIVPDLHAFWLAKKYHPQIILNSFLCKMSLFSLAISCYVTIQSECSDTSIYTVRFVDPIGILKLKKMY